MLVIIVQPAVPVREIDDRINALMVWLTYFYEALSLILVMCLKL